MIGYGTKSPYFNQFRQGGQTGFFTNEQNLFESMSNETARLYGIDCYYVAGDWNSFDQLYGATESRSYTNAWQIAIVQKNVLGFTGDREFMDKFAGLQIRDQIIFSIPRKTFDQVIAQDSRFPRLPVQITQGSRNFEASRPREGDLIWYPFNQKCFKIMYVNLTDMFWQFGKLYTWEVTCELFEYSGEQFNTGIPNIDRIQVEGSLNIYDWAMTDTDGSPLLFIPYNDLWVVDQFAKLYPLQDNAVVDAEANGYIDWHTSNIDPFADANNVGGTI